MLFKVLFFALVASTDNVRFWFTLFATILRFVMFKFLMFAPLRFEKSEYSHVAVSSLLLQLLKFKLDSVYPFPLMVPLNVLLVSINEKSLLSKSILFFIS